MLPEHLEYAGYLSTETLFAPIHYTNSAIKVALGLGLIIEGVI